MFLIVFLPETRGKVHTVDRDKTKKIDGSANRNGSVPRTDSRKASVEERIKRLATLQRFHFLFLGIFSGVEFTLTFLTFDCKYKLRVKD